MSSSCSFKLWLYAVSA